MKPKKRKLTKLEEYLLTRKRVLANTAMIKYGYRKARNDYASKDKNFLVPSYDGKKVTYVSYGARMAYVINLLRAKGYPERIVDNIAGNIAHESGFNPYRVKGEGTKYEYKGLCQWNKLRRSIVNQVVGNKNFESQNVFTALKAQVDFIDYELRNGELSSGTYKKPLNNIVEKSSRPSNDDYWTQYALNNYYFGDRHQHDSERIGAQQFVRDWKKNNQQYLDTYTADGSFLNNDNPLTPISDSKANSNYVANNTTQTQSNVNNNAQQGVPPAQAVSTNVSTPPAGELKPINDTQQNTNVNLYSNTQPTKYFPIGYNKPKFKYDTMTNQYFKLNDKGQMDTSQGVYKPSEDEETNYNKQAPKFGWSTKPQNSFANGGGINIKPSHEGLFSKAAKAHGMSVQQYAASILRNKDNHSATLIKRANFARNAAGWSHAEGGYLNDEDNTPDGGMNTGNTNLNNYGYGVTRYATGGTHEQNRNGGIQQGIAPDGQPNLVEQGEVRYDNYIYSNRLSPNKMRLKRNNLPANMANKTYARIAEDLSNEVQERPNDPISLGSLKAFMDRLRKTQDIHKKVKDISLDPDAINAIKRGAINAKGNKYLDI